MLALGHQHSLLPYVVAIVSALSVQELFVETEQPPTTAQEVGLMWKRVGHLEMRLGCLETILGFLEMRLGCLGMRLDTWPS